MSEPGPAGEVFAMMYMLDQKCFGAFEREIGEMHRLRYRVFKERLNWDVTVSGDMEIDEYDALKPVYLLYCNDDGRVEGCVRFLPTTGPNMLRDSFPALLGPHPAPESPRIWESSRFSLDIDAMSQRTESGVSRATFELIAAMGEFGIMHNLTHIVTVTDVLVERILRRAGVPWRRIHNAQRIGNSLAVAGFAEISEWIVDHLCTLGGLRRPVLTAPMGLKETA
jgi:N-acyl-L-homoserine lactone synthetase